jgi:hypothetical protein
VAVVSPAFSAAPLTKAKVKKIAKKQAKKQINKLVPGIVEGALGERLILVGAIHMNVGDAEHTIGTFGPFTLSSRCILFMGDVEAAVLIRTSEADSTLQSAEYYLDFQPAGGAFTFSDEVHGNPPGGTTVGSGSPLSYHGAHAVAPSGTSIMGVIEPITNFDGAHCYFDGYLINLTA